MKAQKTVRRRASSTPPLAIRLPSRGQTARGTKYSV
jgi:hypothetical protein